MITVFEYNLGIILLLISGLHIGWGIWRTILARNMPQFDVKTDMSILIISSWYVGAILGSIASAILLYRIKKKFIYVSISCMC